MERALELPHGVSFARPFTTLADLTGYITRDGDYYFAHGGFADVWKGTWLKDTVKYKVAIKVVRTTNESDKGCEKMYKRLNKEIMVWQKLDHENIIPLLGITFDFGRGSPMGMVCPWLENGNLNGYLDRCGTALTLRERFRILSEIAAGLSYLHSCGVVHGDLSGSNVLLDSEGKAFLADFGLSNIVAEACGPSYVTSSIGGSIRWAAPEYFRISAGSSVSTVTTHGDIYSYGSVMLQVLSGQLPYHQLKRDTEVLFELDKGVRPPRPPQLANEHWALICLCWMEQPSARPHARDIFEIVQHHHLALSVTADCQIVHSIPPSVESVLAENGSIGCSATPSSLTLISAFLTIILSHIIP